MRYLNYLLLAALLGALQGCFPVVAVGLGSGALMAADRRTAGTYVEDESIEDRVINKISIEYHDTVHVNVTSYNLHVLLTGEVPNEEAKAGVAKIVAGIANVKVVSNELVVGPNTDIGSRSKDSLITANVKLRFINSKKFQSDHVKVVTENGTVYLLGLLYRKEADTAADIASTTSGVQRVVKVFEYLD